MMHSPEQQAARIIAHYLKHLTIRTGLRWTSANDRDMALVAELLGVEVEDSDAIPAYDEAPPVRSDRVTEVFERDDYGDPQFARFRGRRQWEEQSE